MIQQTSLLWRVKAGFFLIITLGWSGLRAIAWEGAIKHDPEQKLATLSDGRGEIVVRLNYDRRCVLDQVIVRGREVVAESGAATGIRLAGQWFSTKIGIATPSVAVRGDTLTVSGICFGKPGAEVRERWQFIVQADRIVWRIARTYASAATLDDIAFPEWNFSTMGTWTGAMLDSGGVVWNKYLETPNATYGAHVGMVTFWNREQRDCLRITPVLPKDQFGAARFSHQQNNSFSFHYSVSGNELKPKHGLSRYLSDSGDLWAPFSIQPGEVSAEFVLQALDYDQAYDRGTFHGVNGASIRELLNTQGRYGVIDSKLTGGNGWRSGYICLHEQWFAQIGLALADPFYTTNYSQTLDYFRDHAVAADGRVKSRWKYDAGDAMPGTYDANGFYEAQWGILLDAQPDYVLNVAEQFNLTGDLNWLAGQKSTCEKALEYLMRREVGHSGLVAMLTDSHKEQKGSDWIDIIWASYENALVNAELYGALQLWADAEDALGDDAHAAGYRDFAARLKKSFNRPVAEGGFWNPTNQWYIYWRDKDDSIHGDNLVTPVNFAAIGYGLCDDADRRKAILGRIESEMRKENLFCWPLSFFPYAEGEGAGSNYPFPRYENGDLFLSWGELAVRAYAAYDPALALKYIKNTLARYDEDGLSFQRYLRRSQRGEGDDILAGNCMPIVGLYRNIYGVQPKPNRLYLEPHLLPELNGTKLRYPLRGQVYEIDLSTQRYAITAGAWTLRSSSPFGANASSTGLEYFPGTNKDWTLSVSDTAGQAVSVEIENWSDDPSAPRRWTEESSAGKRTTRYVVARLLPGTPYSLLANGKLVASLRTDKSGEVTFVPKRSTTGLVKFELVRAKK